MASQPEIIQYDVGVYQLEVTDPVDGGVGAISNAPLLNLSNRTAYLKQHVDNLEAGTTIPPTLAPINSPALTGTPTAPTPPLGDNSQKIAPTAFVQGTINGITTKDVSGGINVTLSAAEAGAGILVFTGALTANIAVIVPASTKSWIVSNRTSGAFTLTLKTAAGTGIAIVQGRNIELWCDGTNVVQSTNDFTDAALTGTPTAPTPASADSSTKVANTAFVYNATDGMATVNVAGSADVTVSALQYGSAILKLTGAITADINLILPSIPGQWIVANGSTGSFNITAKTAAGTGVVLPSNLAVVVYCDGVNVYFASSSAQKSFQTFSYAPAAGTTTLTVLGGYTPGNILVEKNGALLEPADFTATNGTTITVSATGANDTFTVYVYATFSVANAITTVGGTLTGPLTGPASASQTSAGLIQIATNPIALGRTDATTAITPATLGFAEQPVKTASVQFVRAANEILMNAIVTDLGLEVGDVIQISGTTSNNFTMTVESITDPNDINVNYEHRNGAGPLSLTNETVTCTIKRIEKWHSAADGLGQAWVDVTASRVMNTSYLNSTNRSIAVVCGNYGGAAARDAIIYKGGGSAVNADAYSRSSSTNGASAAAFATISASESYAMNSPIGTIYVKERR